MYKVGDRVLFLSKTQYTAQQTMAVVSAVVAANKHHPEKIVVRVLSTGEKAQFDPSMPDEYVKLLPPGTDSIDDALLYLATQNVEM